MAYVKRYVGGFVDLPNQTTAVDSLFLNAVETMALRHDTSDPTADGQVLQWVSGSSRYGPALLLNKNIDPAANIDWSKINSAGRIKNVDISGSAAISKTKLDFGAGLTDGDISPTANIAASKIQQSGLFTALPGSPFDGQEIVLTDSLSAPAYYWRLRYNSTTTKWHALSGSPLYAEVATSEAKTNATAYGDLTTVGPTVTVPVVGDYEVQIGALITRTSDSGYMSFAVGATAAVDVDAVSVTLGATGQATLVTTRRKTAIPAATALLAKYRTVSTGTVSWANRWIRVLPVKLG